MDTLARYEILQELGRGASGVVYAARDRATGAALALKTLDLALLKHVRSAQRLRHRNIVEIHDAGEAGGNAYVAMEKLDGESLRKILDDGPLAIARAIRIARDIASGLAHAHLEGVVHGGVKASNIVVLRSGVAKITDFGIARPGGAALAPEQARGGAVDHRCDVYAFGALFYEMLTHQPPRAELRPPSELNPLVPRALDRIVLSMLAREPADRMPGLPILLQELQRLEDGLGLEPAAKAEREPVADRDAFDHHEAMLMMERESRLRRPSGSRTAIFSAFAFVLAVLAIALTGFIHYSGPNETPATAAAPASPPASPPPAPEPRQPEPRQLPVAAAAPAPEPVPVPVPAPVAVPVPVAQPTVQETQPTAKIPEEQPAASARLVVAVSPRGDIYIDGKHFGTTPPLTTLDLEPGMHRIEVRNGARTPYLTYMTVQAGDVRRIQHDFNAKRMRPPG